MGIHIGLNFLINKKLYLGSAREIESIATLSIGCVANVYN